MVKMSNNLLVTFAVICYKQERFIEEAVKSALAQTYSPLEIVISDDCSPDTTFQIVEKLISNYCGPHKVIINRNKTNLGLADNINRVWELATGEFLVIQAGDDISVPHRTSTMVKSWQSTSPTPDLLYSDLTIIDENSKNLRYQNEMRPVIVSTAINETITGVKVKPFIVGGCSAAYSRSVHDITGPLDKNVIAEDFVYSFRALLGGGVQGIAEPLLMYRQNTASIMGNFKSGRIPEERLLKGEYAKLLEYKKALVAYAFNDPYMLWRLNRRIITVELNIKANEAGVMGKFFILLRLVFTGRLRLFLKLSRQYYNINKIWA